MFYGHFSNAANNKILNKLSFSYRSLVEFIPHRYLWAGFNLLQSPVGTCFLKGHKLFITY